MGAWVFTIAHRRLVDDWRRRSRRPALAECGEEVLTASAGGDVEAEALTALGSATVQWVCSALPVDQGTVLLLRLLADLTVEQVGSVMGRSTEAVKALQRRGLATLRGELAREAAPL